MKGWRVPLVLLAVIILLAVILGIKILNNTPEKQLGNLENNYNNTSNKNNNELIEHDKMWQEYLEQKNNSYKEKEKQEERVETISAIISIITVISYYIIYYKMQVRENFVKYIVISWAALILLGLLELYIPMLIAGIPLLLLNIVMLTDIYKSVGVSPILVLTFIIPIVGIIVSFMVSWKLGEYFGKGTGFKLGLVFLPFIFLPILALTAEA